MRIENFLEIIAKSKIAKHKELISKVVRSAIDITKNNDAEPYLGCSHFGGEPDLPVGSKWPMYDMKPYKFLGQINFAEISLVETELPTNGLLSLFVANNSDDDYYLEPFDGGFIHAIFIPESTKLEPISHPNFTNCKSTVIKFHPTIDIPYDEYQLDDWPFDEEENDIYSEIRSSLHKDSDYLLGYPSHCTLAYNPTPGAGWISLLTIQSDEELDWCWHNGDNLMVFIELERLKNLDFSSLKCDAG